MATGTNVLVQITPGLQRYFGKSAVAMIFSTGRMMYLGILESSRQKNAKYCCLIWIGSKDKKLSRSRF